MDSLTDQEKSVLLAKAMGQSPEHDQNVPQWMIELPGIARNDEHHLEDLAGIVYNLYDPENMALAWRVLNWAWARDDIRMYAEEWWLVDVGYCRDYGGAPEVITEMPPEKAQRLWLDRILELAIEAGIVEVEPRWVSDDPDLEARDITGL